MDENPTKIKVKGETLQYIRVWQYAAKIDCGKGKGEAVTLRFFIFRPFYSYLSPSFQ
jgi:hypothetical protein